MNELCQIIRNMMIPNFVNMETLMNIREKTCDYLDTLTDDMLYEKPENCPYSRLELVLRQFRHLSFHTGMLNGQTAEHTGKFPIYVSEDSIFLEDGSLFGRYVTKKKAVVPLCENADAVSFLR